jgi:aquaporin Z
MRTYLTEFYGTFFLVLTIGLAVLAGTPFAPIAIGSALTVMVYMGGHVSGAHYNPAVTLAVWMRGKLPGSQVLPYWAAQVLGSLVASLTVYLLTGQTFAPAPAPGATALQALLTEALYAFTLGLVVLNVATTTATQGNSFYGLAIGLTIMAGALAAGQISGGAFNPAVGIGPTVVTALLGHGGFTHLWLYLVGPFAGGALAALAFRVQHPEPAAAR